MAVLGTYTGGTGTWGRPLGSTGGEALLKDFTAKEIESMVVANADGFKYFKHRTKDAWDLKTRRVVGTVETAINGAFGAVPEGGTLPAPGASAWRNWEARAAFLYVTMAITSQMLKISKNRQGSIADAYTAENKNVVKKMINELNRCLWGNGTGVLFKSAQALPGLTVDIDTTYGANYPTSTKHLLEGSRVMWGTEAQLAGTGGNQTYCDGYGYIDSITDVDTVVVVKTAGNDPAANDYFIGGENNHAPLVLQSGAIYTGIEPQGFRGVANRGGNTTHDNSTFEGIPGSSVAKWNAQLYEPGGGAAQTETLTEKLLLGVCTRFYNGIGEYPTLMWLDPAVWRELFDSTEADRRYVNVTRINSGLKEDALMFTGPKGDIEMAVDRLAFPGEIVLMRPEAFGYSEMEPMGWWQDDGRIARTISRTPQIEQWFQWWGQFVCTNRKKIMRFRDIIATEI